MQALSPGRSKNRDFTVDIFTAQPLEENKEEEGGKGEEGQEKKKDTDEKVNNNLDLNWVVEQIASGPL